MTGQPHRPALLGLDIGTTNCKLIAFSHDGHILAEASTGYDVHHPRPGFAELDPADILASVTSVMRKIAPVIAECDDLSMAISVQGEAFVLVDGDGKSLSTAPVSIDMRGRDLIEAFNTNEAVQYASQSAGQTLNALTTLAKLLWFQEEESEVLRHCAQVLCVGNYVVRQLGIRPAMDYSMASRMGLLENAGLQWSAALINLAGLSDGIFPPVVPSGALLGTVTAEMARQFGLSQSINIYAGGHDQVCAMLGAGVVNADTALYSIGTTEAIALTLDRRQAGQHAEELSPYPHVVPERYVALMGSQSGGRVLDWLKALRGIGDTETLLSDMPDLPSHVTAVPHFSGSGSMLADEHALGTFAGLNFQTTPQELTHAVLEGITMEQALALRQSHDLGFSVKRLRGVGGGSRSAKWMQIKADIMGLPIDCMENADTACAGAAMLAGMGSGVLASLDDALAKFTRIGTTYRPRAEYTGIYRKKLDLYHDIYRSQTAHQAQQAALAAKIEALSAKTKDAE